MQHHDANRRSQLIKKRDLPHTQEVPQHPSLDTQWNSPGHKTLSLCRGALCQRQRRPDRRRGERLPDHHAFIAQTPKFLSRDPLVESMGCGDLVRHPHERLTPHNPTTMPLYQAVSSTSTSARQPTPVGWLTPTPRARLGWPVGRCDRAAAPHMRVGPRGRALSRVQRPPQWRAARAGGADATPT